LAFGLGQYGGGVRKVDLLYSQSFLANLIISGLGLFCASLLAPLLLSVWLGNAYSPIMTDIARIGCVGFFANFTAYISTAYLNASGRSVVIVKIQLFEIAVLFLILAIFKSDCGVVGLCFVFSARLLADSIFLMIASISVRVASVGFSYVMCVEASLFSLFVILIGSTVFIAI
jgi:O-antigen/teichoic acid export membrane protein